MPGVHSSLSTLNLANADGVYQLAAWQDSESIAGLFGLDWQEAQTQELVQDLVQKFVTKLAPETTGLILDPRTGLSALDAKPPEVGLGLRIAELQTTDTVMVAPKLLSNWSVEHISNNYASVYLKLYYHPAEEAALEKKQLVAELFDFCEYEHTPLIVDLGLTQLAEDEDREALLLETVAELRTIAHLLGLPYPGNGLLAATVTSELDIPWIVTSADQDYDQFKEEVRSAVGHGARGFLVGQALYQPLEAARFSDMSPDHDAIDQLISTTIRDRLIELGRIAGEAFVAV